MQNENTKLKIILPAVAQVAQMFKKIIQETLTPEQIKEIDRLNMGERNPAICHSHEFCDANALMEEAFARLGLDVFATWDGKITPNVQDVWDQAWAYAKVNLFASPIRNYIRCTAYSVNRLALVWQHSDGDFVFSITGNEGRTDAKSVLEESIVSCPAPSFGRYPTEAKAVAAAKRRLKRFL